jgi:hypothetical protein
MYNVLEKLKAMEAARVSPPPAREARGGEGSGVGGATARSTRRNAPHPNPPRRFAGGGDAPVQAAVPALTPDEERIKDEGLILILKELHEKLDRLVFEAYGWPQTLTDEQILENLVALNRERAAEEKRGHVRWLRPDYQIPRFGKKLDRQAAKEEDAQMLAPLDLPEVAGRKTSFPTDAVAQTAAVFAALASATAPLDAAAIAAGYRKTKNLEATIAGVLNSLARLGHVASRAGGRFEIRRAA